VPVVRRCALLDVPRAAVYRWPSAPRAHDLETMRLIDELHLKHPFYGARKIAVVLTQGGHKIGRKRVARLMRLMGIEVLYRKPNLSRRHPQHKIYPYLLRNLDINRVHQVWSCDITYIPMSQGFLYLVAVIDWHSRMVLSWRLSNTMDKSFCIEAVAEALDKYGAPEIFNTDQGVQFTCEAFITQLAERGIKISMDGKGRCLDNIFCERLWRSLKYEEVYLKAYQTPQEAREEIGKWFLFYNNERPHQSLKYKTPCAFFEATLPCGYGGQGGVLPTSPQAQQQQKTDQTDKEKEKEKEDSQNEANLIPSTNASHVLHAGAINQQGCFPP